MSDRDSDSMDVNTNEVSQPLQRSPLSQGGSPAQKRTRSLPDPAPIAREAIKWIRHTIEEHATKRAVVPVEMQRNMYTKLSALDSAVHDLVIANLNLKSQLEESRRSAEICVGAAAAQFGAELRLREAAHEQTLEAVVARYAEKEAARALEVAEMGKNTPCMPLDLAEAPTYATATATKRETGTRERKADRSRSRAEKRNNKVKEAKKEVHVPAFILKECPGKSAKNVRNLIWTQVVEKKIRPKCQTVTIKTGKVILKPTDKETSDVLRQKSKVCPSLLQTDNLRWPRLIIKGVCSDTVISQRDIFEQNPELGISEDTMEEVVRPVFRTGPRDRAYTNCVVEVNPNFYGKFENTMIYLGFMRCTISPYEEVTQCHLCLRFGHPAAKCNDKEAVCAHCSRKGHKAADCPAAEADPTCANCRGKHSARDKTCSARTAYLFAQVRRTDYGTSQ
ncbi:Uncharacterized protein FWK35_00015806 [Aphis craccivora]|uniref:CCHC-type domain-containing protein n=1 Tax=Aphis craccivora TaxID=307492 RepID=A0A6G0YFP2_APHCR|nr:Uncharacterized protein FWK35_00015806 [Aphis craccivora]